MKSAESCHSIEEIRGEIDRIDQSIIDLLGERSQYVKAIVQFKEPSQESIVAQERYNAVIASRRVMAEKCGLDPDLVEKLYRGIMNHFIDEELKIVKIKK
jgi:isochorismate pyruvate lyase